MLGLLKKLLFIMVFSLFIIFVVLYSFESNSVLRQYGANCILAFLHWFAGFIQLKWGTIHSTGQKLVLLNQSDSSVGVLQFVITTFFYGISGLILAFIASTYLTYKAIFDNSITAKTISGFISFLSGIHIILFCFILKIVIGHEEGFHPLILVAIAIGSYTYSDICQYQTGQFQKLKSADFITAARSWGDSIFKHARRSIAIGLLSQWDSLVGIVFASTIIVEYFFKIQGVGYAIDRYLIRPNLNYPSLSVESEFFMIISALVILTVVTLSGIKERLSEILTINK